MTLKFNNVRPIIDSNWGIVKKKVSSKKYIIDQKPPYLMRQICVLQWEEIKTKNSEETHHYSFLGCSTFWFDYRLIHSLDHFFLKMSNLSTFYIFLSIRVAKSQNKRLLLYGQNFQQNFSGDEKNTQYVNLNIVSRKHIIC